MPDPIKPDPIKPDPNKPGSMAGTGPRSGAWSDRGPGIPMASRGEPGPHDGRRHRRVLRLHFSHRRGRSGINGQRKVGSGRAYRARLALGTGLGAEVAGCDRVGAGAGAAVAGRERVGAGTGAAVARERVGEGAGAAVAGRERVGAGTAVAVGPDGTDRDGAGAGAAVLRDGAGAAVLRDGAGRAPPSANALVAATVPRAAAPVTTAAMSRTRFAGIKQLQTRGSGRSFV